MRLLVALTDTGGAPGRRLSRLRPGEKLTFGVDADGTLREVVLEQSDHLLRFERGGGDGFTVAREPLPPVPQPVPAQAEADNALPTTVASSEPAAGEPLEVEVKPGDSFYLLFKRQGFSESEFAALLRDDVLRDELKRVHPGQRFTFHADAEGGLQRLDYEIEPERSLRVDRVADRFQSAYVQTELERRVANAAGSINSSLFLAGQASGLSDKLIMQMAEIFGWDIDFALDIRGGDRFSVIYTELFKDGEKVKDGPILAAEFVNQGRTVRALRFQDEEGRIGYFTPDGLSMRKAFLRTPVEFGRISSRFDLNRMHPVLHTIRAHRGVDYAARRGTPVKATGDAKVAFAGRKGGYGKTVILRHGGTYTTLYAHLHNLARGIRAGASVTQGQVIGDVGSTFHEQTQNLLGQLDLLSRTQLAQAP